MPSLVFVGMAPVSWKSKTSVYRVNRVSLACLGFLILLYPVLAKQAEPRTEERTGLSLPEPPILNYINLFIAFVLPRMCVSPTTQVPGIKPRSLGLGSKHLYPLSHLISPFVSLVLAQSASLLNPRGSAAGWGSHRRGKGGQQVIWLLSLQPSPPQVLISPHQLPLAKGRKVLSRQSTGAGVLMTIIAVIAVIKLRG